MSNTVTEMYQALKKVQEKFDKGVIFFTDKEGKISNQEFTFVFMKVASAIAKAEADSRLKLGAEK